MQPEQLKDLVIDTLEDMKGVSIQCLAVNKLTSITDYMVIVSGNSNRHVKALSATVLEKSKQAGVQALGIEGTSEGEWVLVDLGDVVIHIMLPGVRAFYQLEKLWTMQSNPDQDRIESSS